MSAAETIFGLFCLDDIGLCYALVKRETGVDAVTRRRRVSRELDG